jgi:trigger factor
LKIQTTPRDDHQLKVVVEIENDQLERKMHRAARVISEKAKIPGFRPGKAPYEVVVRYAGEEQVKNEAIEMLVDEVYPEMLKEQNIEPGAMGSFEDIVSTDPLTLSFIVPLSPVVELNDFQTVRAPYDLPGITDKAVDKTLDQYRNYFATLEPVEGPAAEGNVAFITIKGISGDEEIVPERSLQIKITPKSDEEEQEWPFKGFNRKLIGLKTDEEKKFAHTYPEDFSDEKLKGKKLEYTVKVQSVKNVILPEMDEEFLKNFGEYKTADEFKVAIRKQLEADGQAEYDFNFYKNVLNDMRAKAVIKYPPQILEEEKQDLVESFTHELSHQRMDLETYLKMRNMNKDEFVEKEITPQATERLERNLIMREISKVEKIELTEAEMQTGYQEALNDLASTQDINKLVKNQNKEKLVNAIALEGANRMMNRRIYDVIKAVATGTYTAPVKEVEVTASETTPSEKDAKEEKPKTKKTRSKASKTEAGPTQGE